MAPNSRRQGDADYRSERVVMGQKSANHLPPLRYAHPFFTATPVSARAVSPATGTRRMAEYVSKKLGPIPCPSRAPIMDLEDIIGDEGVAEIRNTGSIRFHVVGDTGGGDGTPQVQVAEAMESDYEPSAAGRNPALFIHLGDVVYEANKAKLYRDDFYEPYMEYPGKIVAIPGNHDGETFKDSDPKSLKAFRKNFCAREAVVPKIASDVRIFRQTMTQPGVYWRLSCPFVNIIGLYSNIASGPGNLLGAKRDDQQIEWLTKTLARLSDDEDERALVVATHHPPFNSGRKGSSVEMLAQIDKACAAAGVFPHAMLAGHRHNYQRYTRTIEMDAGSYQVPCIVAGCGGHADSSAKEATGERKGDVVYERSRKGFGYLMLTVNPNQLVIEMYAVTDEGKTLFDGVAVDVGGHRLGNYSPLST
jgi:hypothetical protein